MATATLLSTNDSSVLNALFDPEASLSGGVNINESVPQDFPLPSLLNLQESEKVALLPLNKEDPSQADIELSISSLSNIISNNPNYASAWNNRAQAKRMLFQPESLQDHPTELKGVLDDLAHAITLSTPRNPTDSISSFDARVLASAHTHRGYLIWLASRSDAAATKITSCIEEFRGMDKDRLEEMASREFALGGRYGNDTAKQLAVRTNPYAKLCGSIVKEAMQKEIADHYQIPITQTISRQNV